MPPLNSLALAMRRHAHRVPDPIRERLRIMVTSREPRCDEFKVWDSPLVGSATAHAQPLPDGPPVSDPARPRISSDRSADGGLGSLSCVLVTGPMDYGGLAGVVADLAKGLPEHGVRVRVAVLGDAEPPAIGRVARDVMAHGVCVSHLARSDFAEWLTAVSPDVMSSHGAPDWALRTANGFHIPVVDTLHGGHTFFGDDHSEATQRALMCSAIVAVSDMIRTQFLSACPAVQAKAVVTIPNGTGAAVFDASTRASTRHAWGVDREFVFASLGRFSVQKNAFGLVAAFRELDQVKYPSHLVITGDADDRTYAAQVARLRDRAPHAERIHLRRSGPSTNILAGADCFVLNSFFEGCALASMEALVSGLPTISSDVAGAKDQLASTRPVGRLVANPLGDPLTANWQSTDRHKFAKQTNRDELIHAMQDVLVNREDWARNRSHIAADSLSRFNLSSCCRRHAQVLSAAAAAPTTPAVISRKIHGLATRSSHEV